MSRIGDVAKRAGVSSATVSRVLTDKPHVSEAVRRRVLEAAKALNYRPNRIARSLRERRSRVIGLMVSDIQNPFFNTVVRAVEDAVHPHGYGVFLCNSGEDPGRERLYLELLVDEQVAGVILAATQEAAAYAPLRAAGVPLTLIDRQVAGLEVDTVVTDNTRAACAVVGCLLDEGHERVGAIVSELSISTGRERLEGYREALLSRGLTFDPALVRYGRPTQEEGYALAKSLLGEKKPPTALFTGSKLLTSGTFRYLFDRGIRVPDELALASFDTLDWSPLQPEMYTVEQPAYELGAHAVRLLLARLEDPERPPERIVLPSKVVRTRSPGSAVDEAVTR